MRKLSHPLHLKVTLPILILGAIAGGVWLSVHTNEPHWLNRAGALVAAIAAAAILVQISAELQLEKDREFVETQVTEVSRDILSTMPMDDLEIRVTINRLELQKKKISRHRLIVAASVVTGAIIGELLHGFGDIVLCQTIMTCNGH